MLSKVALPVDVLPMNTATPDRRARIYANFFVTRRKNPHFRLKEDRETKLKQLFSNHKMVLVHPVLRMLHFKGRQYMTSRPYRLRDGQLCADSST